MTFPLFPSLNPKLVDSLWFSVDTPCDEETELHQLEQEHRHFLDSIIQKNADIVPIGKPASENIEEEEEDEDDDDNDNDDDEESVNRDDEDEDVSSEDMEDVEVSYGPNSPLSVIIRVGNRHNGS